MVVTQPWLRVRRLSLGAAAQGQYYLSGVNFGAPPLSDPHFPRPIRSEPPSSPPSSALTEPCVRLSGTASGAGTAANGTVRGHHPHAGHRRGHRCRGRRLLRPRRRRFFVDFAAFSIRPRGLPYNGVGRNTAVGRLGRLPGGAGWPRLGQTVGGGRARGRGDGSDGCRGPRRASARAFRARRARSRNCNTWSEIRSRVYRGVWE